MFSSALHFLALPFFAKELNFFAPHFCLPIHAASAPGERAPFLARDFLSEANRFPLPSFGFRAAMTSPCYQIDQGQTDRNSQVVHRQIGKQKR